MNRQPQDTSPLAPAGEGRGSTPPLREFSPQFSPISEPAPPTPWSAFLARILKPAARRADGDRG